jgi:hypothetical protein
MTSKQLNIVLAIIIVVLLGVIGFMLLRDGDETNTFSQQESTQPETNTGTPSEMAIGIPPVSTSTGSRPEEVTMKTYQSPEYGFELKMPVDTKIEVFDHDKYPVVNFSGPSGKFNVNLRRGDTVSLDNYFYLDFPLSGKATLDGQTAGIYKAPEGYCDGPGCGDPFIAYAAKHGDAYYNVVFLGDTQLNTTEKSILASFKFIK